MSPTITHYKFPLSPNSFKVDIALKEKGLEYEDHVVNLVTGDQHTKEFHAINNREQIPALTYGDAKVSESSAILQFIDTAFPNEVSLTSKDPVNLGQCLKYVAELDTRFSTKNVAFQVVFLKQGKEDLGDKVEEFKKEIAVWEGYLENKKFLAGDSVSLADISLFPMIGQAHLWLGLDLAKYPNIEKWYKAFEQRPSVKGHKFFDLAGNLDEMLGLDATKRRVLA
ncbi:glutathione Stransferase [Perkinsus chesapeaki]|uniref:Glutathione Stransferase n=1 Tax=Perkinsus chesapeaki TaxID=330153 RepID=A0A7J6M5X7_PERCH|nr:glutathione Stransferase [Perkinsus chesapeaki]